MAILEFWGGGWVRSASATWSGGKGGGGSLENWDQRRGESLIDTDVRVRWVLVRRVEEPMGVVFWPPGPSPTMMWTDIL